MEEVEPPENFSEVEKGIYRSSFPTLRHFPFLKKKKIKSIIFLCPEEVSTQYKRFMEDSGITLFQFGVGGNKEPFDYIPDDVFAQAIEVLLDSRNHPIMVHCNKGKHRTGSLIGCLRRLQRWSLAMVFDEYCRFAGSKPRLADQLFIELFHGEINLDSEHIPEWLHV
uniref:diphosphoinositol-polyphosphate diphosphatase n=1 Tax=Palpitomonas bilix TaxID=652834 RepID=A0A7S3GK28_9EUKA|mmetsp:Transcript_6920/g.17527  ORF Transcript_6920/g.17527 Transcript_6920/m.17527 type:complete len:167 (+) Transcript_6920:303-803(+)